MGDLLMARVTNEVLYAEIINIKKDTTDIKTENKEQWKSINKNSQDIASQKSVIRIIEVFILGIVSSIIAYVWKGHA